MENLAIGTRILNTSNNLILVVEAVDNEGYFLITEGRPKNIKTSGHITFEELNTGLRRGLYEGQGI